MRTSSLSPSRWSQPQSTCLSSTASRMVSSLQRLHQSCTFVRSPLLLSCARPNCLLTPGGRVRWSWWTGTRIQGRRSRASTGFEPFAVRVSDLGHPRGKRALSSLTVRWLLGCYSPQDCPQNRYWRTLEGSKFLELLSYGTSSDWGNLARVFGALPSLPNL